MVYGKHRSPARAYCLSSKQIYYVCFYNMYSSVGVRVNKTLCKLQREKIKFPYTTVKHKLDLFDKLV